MALCTAKYASAPEAVRARKPRSLRLRKEMKTMQSAFRHLAWLIASLLLTACAGNTPSLDTRSDHDCPAGQVLVCKGSDANSRVPGSKLNTKDICICREADAVQFQ